LEQRGRSLELPLFFRVNHKMLTVVVAVWVKVYVVEVKLEVVWTDEVFAENPDLSTV